MVPRWIQGCTATHAHYIETWIHTQQSWLFGGLSEAPLWLPKYRLSVIDRTWWLHFLLSKWVLFTWEKLKSFQNGKHSPVLGWAAWKSQMSTCHNCWCLQPVYGVVKASRTGKLFSWTFISKLVKHQHKSKSSRLCERRQERHMTLKTCIYCTLQLSFCCIFRCKVWYFPTKSNQTH